MTVIEVVQQGGDLLVLVAAGISTASVVVHSQVRPVPWWRTAMGRHLMAYMATMAAVLDLSVIRLAAGASLDVPWFAGLRVVVFAAVPAVMGWRLAIQLRARRDDTRRHVMTTPPEPRRGANPVQGVTVFKRDPSLYISAIAAILGVGVSLGLRGLDAHQAAAIMAVITALGGVWTAVHTRPIPPSLFTSFLGALAILLAAYEVNVSQELLAAVQVAVSSLVGILTWQSVSPTGQRAAVRAAR